MTQSGHAPADTLDGFAAIRNSGLRIALRNYKVPNGKLNVTVGKRTPILNSCQPAVLGRLLDISRGAGSDDSVIAVVAVSHSLFTKHRKLPETTSPNLGSRNLTHALRTSRGNGCSRLIVIFVRGHAANAFAVWEFSWLIGG